MAKLCIKNGNVILPNVILKNTAVLIEEEIKSVGNKMDRFGGAIPPCSAKSRLLLFHVFVLYLTQIIKFNEGICPCDHIMTVTKKALR